MSGNNLKNRQGFTLIEMLVVIGIIGVLASLVLVGLGGARRAGADAKKIANLNQVRNSLELFYLKNQKYPDGDGVTIASLVGTASDKLNVGRLTLDDTYLYKKDGNSYIIGVTLAEGTAEGYQTGSISSNNCNSLTFYCLTGD